jgi:hypothetical protein
MRPAVLLLVLTLTPAASVATMATQTTRPATARGDIELPPLSYVCTMPGDEDVIEDHAGRCRKCGMELVPVRLDSVWTCATRPLLVVAAKPGRCPVDGTALVQVTASVSWSCKDKPSQPSLEPGTCADGSPMVKQYAARAHGNHNPQHGGLFFMAADAWHHLEGTYLPTGVFRMHFYDDFTKPLPASQVAAMKATLVTTDPSTGKEVTTPLVRNGRTLQARIGKLPLPATMHAQVQFKADGPPNRFDFSFDSYSKEPVATATMTSAAPATASPSSSTASAPAIPAPAATTPATPSAAASPSASVDPALLTLPIPDTVPEMLTQLRARTDQIRAFIERGSFAAIYVPAFQAKDLALALDEHKKDLPAERQKIAQPAIAKLVRAAYLLDAFGDIGNKQQISEAYGKFVEAANDIQSAFPAKP